MSGGSVTGFMDTGTFFFFFFPTEEESGLILRLDSAPKPGLPSSSLGLCPVSLFSSDYVHSLHKC